MEQKGLLAFDVAVEEASGNRLALCGKPRTSNQQEHHLLQVAPETTQWVQGRPVSSFSPTPKRTPFPPDGTESADFRGHSHQSKENKLTDNPPLHHVHILRGGSARPQADVGQNCFSLVGQLRV